MRSRGNAVEGLHPAFSENYAIEKPLIFKLFWLREHGIRLAPIPSA
jgi:hypothetical protein